MRLGDRIAVMRDGRIVQIGTAEDILVRPADDYVASFTQDVDRSRVLTAGAVMDTGIRGDEADCDCETATPGTPSWTSARSARVSRTRSRSSTHSADSWAWSRGSGSSDSSATSRANPPPAPHRATRATRW